MRTQLSPLDPVWIVPGAVVCLSPGLRLAPDGLMDPLGNHFTLNRMGVNVAALCASPIVLDDLIELVAAQHPDVDPSQVSEQVRQFVATLTKHNLVSVHQSFVRELWTVARSFSLFATMFLVDKRMLGQGGRFPVRRYAPDARSIMRSCVEAHQPVLWLGMTITGVFAVLGFDIDTINPYLPSTVPQLMAALMVYFLLIPLAAIVHEFGHWYAAGLLGSVRTGAYARRGVAAVTFVEPDPKRAAIVTLAGPLAGLVVPLLVVAGYVAIGAEARIGLGVDQLGLPLVLACGAVSLMQLLSLTPLTVDGRQFLGYFAAREGL